MIHKIQETVYIPENAGIQVVPLSELWLEQLCRDTIEDNKKLPREQVKDVSL